MTVARAVWNQIESNDYRLMRRVHRWRAPRWFRVFMIVITRLGDGWLWYAVGMTLVIYGGDCRFLAIGAGAMASAAGILLFRTLKRTSRRQRLRNRAALLGFDLAARQVFFSIRTFHHFFCSSSIDWTFLPGPTGLLAGGGFPDRFFSNHPRNALS